jgi:DNA uptake protein ComE-like DNA-binding protein
MTTSGKSTSFLSIAAICIVVSLVGCAANSPSPTQVSNSTNTPASQTIKATPTAESVTMNEATETVDQETTAEATLESVSSANAATCTKLNLNTLTEDQLMSTIPNFSSRMVREFFEYRPYVSIQQFRREIGKYVDDAQVAQYEQYVFVPVDPNNADADTLKQIPGVDDALATSLTAGRPYASNQAFLDVLSKSLNAQQLAEAGCYMVTSA